MKPPLFALLACLALAGPVRAAVDPNLASLAQLQTIPGVGPAIAARIVAERARAPFADVDDFASRVRGVGPATLRRMVGGGLVVSAVRAATVAEAGAPAPQVIAGSPLMLQNPAAAAPVRGAGCSTARSTAPPAPNRGHRRR